MLLGQLESSVASSPQPMRKLYSPITPNDLPPETLPKNPSSSETTTMKPASSSPSSLSRASLIPPPSGKPLTYNHSRARPVYEQMFLSNIMSRHGATATLANSPTRKFIPA